MAELLRGRGLAHRSLGRWDDAIEDWGKTLPIIEELADWEVLARTSWDLNGMLIWQGRFVESIEVSRRGLELIGPDVSAGRCRLLGVCGLVLGLSGEFVAGGDMLSEALAMAEVLLDPLCPLKFCS